MENLKDIRSIFVQCPNWVGDMVMATSTLRTLRNLFPQAQITLGIKPGLAKMVAGADWCNHIFIYDKKKYRGIHGWLKVKQELKKHHYDLAVVLPNSIRSGLIGKFSRAKIRIGYQRPGDFWLLTHSLKRPWSGGKKLPNYMGNYYNCLLQLITKTETSLKSELPLSPETQTTAEQIWQQAQPKEANIRITIAPGASFGSSKLWPESYFAKAIDLLATDYSAKFLLVPGPGEETIANKICQFSKAQVEILPPDKGDLEMLKGIIHQSQLLICNDSGARHIAHAFGIPSIVVIGPTDPGWSENPLTKDFTAVLNHDIECAPCHLKQCPYDHHGCMTGIKPERVYQEAKKLLSITPT